MTNSPVWRLGWTLLPEHYLCISFTLEEKKKVAYSFFVYMQEICDHISKQNKQSVLRLEHKTRPWTYDARYATLYSVQEEQ